MKSVDNPEMKPLVDGSEIESADKKLWIHGNEICGLCWNEISRRLRKEVCVRSKSHGRNEERFLELNLYNNTQ